MDKEKLCIYCRKYYPESRFGVALTKDNKIYRRRKCFNCYRSTKQKLIQKYFQWLNDYKKEHGCVMCQTTDARVLDFHHKDDKNKLFAIGTFRRSVGLDRIREEISKCEIVCANCHRIIHYEERNKSMQNGL